MELTKVELAVLERLNKYRTAPPTLAERLRAMLWWMSALLVLCVALGVLLMRLKIPGIAFLPVGFFLGVLGREIGNQRLYVKWWHVNREIMDWNRVEQLLNDAKTTPQPGTGQPKQAAKTRVKWAIEVGLACFAVVFGITVGADQALAYVYNPVRNNPPRSVIVLTASWCPYCEGLRRHLLELNIPYTELDVDHTTEGRFGFTAVRARGIPVTIVGKHVPRGVGKTAKWEEIDAALKEAGYLAAPATQPDAETPAAAETHAAVETHATAETHTGTETLPGTATGATH